MGRDSNTPLTLLFSTKLVEYRFWNPNGLERALAENKSCEHVWANMSYILRNESSREGDKNKEEKTGDVHKQVIFTQLDGHAASFLLRLETGIEAEHSS